MTGNPAHVLTCDCDVRVPGGTATLFLISAAAVSRKNFARLASGLIAATTAPARAIRLQDEGEGLWAALDALAAAGPARIVLRPVGVPFSQSLKAWLPGAAGDWLARSGDAAPELFLADEPGQDPLVLRAIADAEVPMRRIVPQADGHFGKGWDAPPRHRHHILVCTGPRCHLRDAPALVQVLEAEIGRAGLSRDCLVTTTGCLYPCNAGPIAVVYPTGRWVHLPDRDAVARFVHRGLKHGEALPDLDRFAPVPAPIQKVNLMTPDQIYDHYGVPADLRLHMLRTAAIADLILANWEGPPVDRRGMARWLLIHDIGDIVTEDAAGTGMETAARSDLRIASAGDAMRARDLVARSVGLAPEDVAAFQNGAFVNLGRNLATGNIAAMVAVYADCRQHEGSVRPLVEALAASRARFPDFYAAPGMTEALEAMPEVEARVALLCGIDLADIDDAAIAPGIERLRGKPL